MLITATINGFANASHEDAAFAVHIQAYDRGDHDRLVPLKPMTVNQVELAAAEYVCQTIHPGVVPLTDLIIYTCNPYLAGVAEKIDGKWKTIPRNNIDLVNKVRLSFERFKSVKVEVNPDSPIMAELKTKARSNRTERTS